jgi:hypothetical protein
VYLEPGDYVLEVRSQFYQPAEVQVSLPARRAVSLRLLPGYAYPFPAGPLTTLRGTVVDHAGAGIAGAVVGADHTTATCRTDDTGQWVLTFPPRLADTITTVHLQLPVGPTIDVANVCVRAGRENGLSPTALRGAIRRVGGIGIGRATVRVGADTVRTAADGAWRYHFDFSQAADHVRVEATVGDVTKSEIVLVQPRATLVVPTFVFEGS